MAALAAAKFATSILSLASGAPGGVFGPIFFIGAMTGGAFRALSAAVLPEHTGPRGSYALIGLGAFLAACTHAPLTAIFLLFETTGNYTVALPTLITVILAVMVATNLEPESIDTLPLARAGKTLHPPREQIMDLIPVAAAFHSEFVTIPADARLPDVLRLMSESSAMSFPVLSTKGKLMGVISLHDVRSFLFDPAIADVVIAVDLCDATFPTVKPETSVGQALGRMEADSRDEIPVVDTAEPWRVIGLLSRGDAIRAYNRTLLGMRTLRDTAGATDALPHWSRDYRVLTLPVHDRWNGRTLRELDLRARFGVSVLALEPEGKPGQTFEIPDPDRRLVVGDGLVVAGPAAKVSAFERAWR
jgi:CIC family chloride channel protein